MALRGRLRCPSDKSISHRALMFAALAEGSSRLGGVLPSADVRSTAKAVQRIGAKLRTEMVDGEPWLVVEGIGGAVNGGGTSGATSGGGAASGASAAGEAGGAGEAGAGAAGAAARGPVHIDCGNSGTTARLMMGICAGLGVQARFSGDASLQARPMRRVADPLAQMGADFHFTERDGCLPAKLRGGTRLSAISYTSPKASAQVKSAVLLAGLFAEGTTTVVEPAKSRDHTERMLGAFGADVQVKGLSASVTGGARLRAHDLRVPADPSSAAFPAVAAACVKNSDIVLADVLLNPTRTGAFELMRRMGCDLYYEHERQRDGELVGDVHVRYSKDVVGVEVAPEEIPSLIDEIPVLSVLACRADGETVFRGCGELRVKESDRLAAIVEAAAELGAQAFVDGDDLHIVGCGGAAAKRGSRAGRRDDAAPLALPTRHDHRLAMTWMVAGRIFERGAQLDDADCVRISWPGFFTDMGSLEHA